ncbi:TPA: helix-turn-helix domain-containing protein [Streptococcus suis]
MNRLKELRQREGSSQTKIAKLLKINEKTVSRWENGESQIKPDKAQALADHFGVPVGYLLGYYEETLRFHFPPDEEGFYKETQKIIDLADKVTEDDIIFEPLQKTKEMAILIRSTRKKIISHYGEEIYHKLNSVQTSVEFYQYLDYLLSEKESKLEADFLIYSSLLGSDIKKAFSDLFKQLGLK